MTDEDILCSHAEDLVAYVDGELSESEIDILEEALSKSQELRGQLSMLCRQRFMLAGMLDSQAEREAEVDTSQIDTETKKIVRNEFSHKTTQKAAAISGPRKNNSVGQKRTKRHKKDQSRQRLTFFAGIAAALLIGVSVYLRYAPEPTVDVGADEQIAHVEGRPVVGYIDGDITWSRAYDVGEQIKVDEEITLADGASLTLNYRDGSILVLDEAAHFHVRDSKRIQLHQGQVQATVRKQLDGNSLAILTEAGQVEVIGTQFSVHVSEQRTLTSVGEGLVKVTSSINKQSYMLRAQEQCSLHRTDPEQIHQYITGKVIEISDKGWEIRLDTPQGEKTYSPQWSGGQPQDGGGLDEQVIKQLRKMRAGHTARIRWIDDGERPRVLQAERIDD